MGKKNLRIVDIARMANVSAGTVDRVIHNRGLVSEDKRKKIEEILKENNYKPNIVASFLASKKNYKLAIVIPTFVKGEYWELVQFGAEKAEAELSDFNISTEFLYFDQFNEKSFEELIPSILDKSYDGVVIATLHRNKVIQLSQMLDEQSKPYIFIDSNIPSCNNVSYFGTDSFVSGAIAAKLMLNFIKKGDPIVIVHPEHDGSIISTQIENRELGFVEYLNKNNFKGEIKKIIFNPSIESVLDFKTIIASEANVGIITFNSRIYEVVNLIKRIHGNFSNLHLIGYDSVGKNLEALKENNLRYLISQRSVQQGYESLKALSNFIIFDHKIEKENLMPIDILIKENASFYKN